VTEEPLLDSRPLSWRPRTRSRGRIRFSFCLARFFFVISLVRVTSLGTGLGGGQGELATSRHARTAGRKWTVYILAMIYLGRSYANND